MSLKGKTAVITGGTRGIGLATARNFLKEGVIVSLQNQLIPFKVPKLSKNIFDFRIECGSLGYLRERRECTATER